MGEPPSGSPTGGKASRRLLVAGFGLTDRAPLGQKGPSCFVPSGLDFQHGHALSLRGQNLEAGLDELCSITGASGIDYPAGAVWSGCGPNVLVRDRCWRENLTSLLRCRNI